MKTSKELAAQVMQKIHEKQTRKTSKKAGLYKLGVLVLLLTALLPLWGSLLKTSETAPTPLSTSLEESVLEE